MLPELGYGKQLELIVAELSPEIENGWLGIKGLSLPGLGLETTNLGCSAVSGEKLSPGSELVRRRAELAMRRASCWSELQKTAADDSGTVLSREVNEECILVMLSSLAKGREGSSEVNTESAVVLVWSMITDPWSALVNTNRGCSGWGGRLMTVGESVGLTGELGGVGVMTLVRRFIPTLFTSLGWIAPDLACIHGVIGGRWCRPGDVGVGTGDRCDDGSGDRGTGCRSNRGEDGDGYRW